MKRHLCLLGLLFTVPAFAQATASGSTTRDAARGPRRPPFAHKSAVQVVLEHRQDLALTEAQASGLERVQASLESKNAPLKQSLDALRPPPPPGDDGARPSGPPPDPSAEDDATRRAHREKAHGLFDQLRANDDQAYQEAEALLTDAQKTQARALLQQEREAHGPPGGHRGPPRGE